MNPIPLLAGVALAEDIPAQRLTRGQRGTVVEILGTEAEPVYLVEFPDKSGQACAFAEVRPDRLIVMHPTQAA
jgi:hypothetical protein